MQEEVRLSVVIPGFRTPEAWWGRSVGSVLTAVEAGDEVICVDDGEGMAFLDGFCRGDGDGRCGYFCVRAARGLMKEKGWKFS